MVNKLLIMKAGSNSHLWSCLEILIVFLVEETDFGFVFCECESLPAAHFAKDLLTESKGTESLLSIFQYPFIVIQIDYQVGRLERHWERCDRDSSMRTLDP